MTEYRRHWVPCCKHHRKSWRVVCNQTYWARTIASKDSKTIVKSFLTAGFCWAPIPIAIASALGLYGLSKMLVVGQTYDYKGISMMFTEAESVAPLSVFLILGFVGLICFLLAVVGASISTGLVCGIPRNPCSCLEKDKPQRRILGHHSRRSIGNRVLVLRRFRHGLGRCLEQHHRNGRFFCSGNGMVVVENRRF